MEAKVNDALNYLFGKYMEDPNGTWEIGDSLNIENTRELGKFLARKGYVRQHAETLNGFSATITILGINMVSKEFDEVQYRILEASIEHKKKSIIEILGLEPGHFKRGLDYATHLKRLGIIECIFATDDIFAEPTFFGKEWYQTNKLKFAN